VNGCDDPEFADLDTYIRAQLAGAAETYASHVDVDARLMLGGRRAASSFKPRLPTTKFPARSSCELHPGASPSPTKRSSSRVRLRQGLGMARSSGSGGSRRARPGPGMRP